jgi:hypothetical protein
MWMAVVNLYSGRKRTSKPVLASQPVDSTDIITAASGINLAQAIAHENYDFARLWSKSAFS